mgnify:CR=1 FL=1
MSCFPPPPICINTCIKLRNTPANTSARRAVHKNYSIFKALYSRPAREHMCTCFSVEVKAKLVIYTPSKKSWRPELVSWWSLLTVWTELVICRCSYLDRIAVAGIASAKAKYTTWIREMRTNRNSITGLSRADMIFSEDISIQMEGFASLQCVQGSKFKAQGGCLVKNAFVWPDHFMLGQVNQSCPWNFLSSLQPVCKPVRFQLWSLQCFNLIKNVL